MKWTYLFDSDGDKENYQTIIIEVCPENLELVKDGKTVAKYVNWNRIFKVTYVDDETDEILGTEEVVSGEKVENIPEITIPEGMCGYDFDYEYADDEVAFEDLPITQDLEVRIYFYDHIWGEGEVTTEATCTESGEKTYICGNTETHTKKEVIAPLGHTLEKVAEVPATCEEAGTKEHWKCTRCNKIFSDAEGKTEIAEPEEIEALGHNFGEWVVVTEATQTERGLKERKCTRCDAKEQEEIPSIDESSWLVDKIYTAGGEQEGNTVKFENLKLNFRPKDYSIGRMLDGYWVGVRFVAPSNVTSETIAATLYNNGSKNTSGELVWKSYKNANDGQREDGRYYMQAWVPLTEETVEEHSKVKSTMVWTYKFATTGDTTNTQDIIIEVNPQNVELIKDGETVAKYVNWNRIFKVTYIDDETDEILGTEEVVSGGKVENIPEITIPEGMCGYDFDYEYADDEVAFEDLPITQDMEVRIYFYDHIWGEGEVTKEATCTESGEKTYTCENNEEHTKKEVIAPLGHNFGEWNIVKEATILEEGKKERICTRCNEKEEEVIPKLETDLMKGDLEGSKTITILDVRLLLQAYINSTETTTWTNEDLYVMDMDGNKKINILDVRLLLQEYINKP